MQDKAILVRNTDQVYLYDGSMDNDFRSDIGDMREMNLGFIQVIYKDNDLFTGKYQLYISNIYCNDGDDSMFAKYGPEISMDALCGSIGWNLSKIGYRFVQVRYAANGISSGTSKIIARGKK